MNQVAVKDAVDLVPSNGGAVTPMDMLDRAVASGASVEVLEKLMGLQERWEKNQARKDFDAAVSAAKAEIQPITRNAKGHNEKRYANFAAIAKEIDPILSKNGLSYRFRTAQADRISVTCIIAHRSGHSEESSLAGPPDATGSKNAIQAIGSTLTYLQRYSLVQALGLAAADDDDGKAGGAGETITQEQADTIRELIESSGADSKKFCAALKVESIATIPAGRYDEAFTRINAYAAAQRAKA